MARWIKQDSISKPGMILESIDGENITADKDLAQYLNRKAGKNTLLVFADGAAKKEIIIKPVTTGEENSLLIQTLGKKEPG
jgi:tricorn protease